MRTEGGRRQAVGGPGASRETLSHERLDVYKLSRTLAVDLYRETASFPSEERFGLASQIRRAAVSIPANIAEGASRRSKREFVHFLSTARGSSSELRVLLEIAQETGHLELSRSNAYEAIIDRVSSMISGLIRRNKTS
ncbi:MAG TPA: four helix bundle protein [Thermoanaerobaculia bacterium]